jgi:flagellar basal-body rod modification protein FlgD
VFTTTQSINTAGGQTFRWDGKMQGGIAAPDGSYSLAIDGKDVAGQPMTVGVR